MSSRWLRGMHRFATVRCAAALAATLTAAASGNAQCLDWDDQFKITGMTGADITAQMVFDDGSGPALFVGGAFFTIAGVPARGIAKWDGSEWSMLGNGVQLTGQLLGVRAFAAFDDGNGPALYAAGEFLGIAGTPASNVAKWNGTSWSAVSSGTNGAVHALAVYDDGSGPALFAAGDFSQAGGAPADRLAKWSGTSWTAVPTSFTPSNAYLRALAVYDPGTGARLYVGGYFQTVASVMSYGIASWNGTNWGNVHFGVSFSGIVYSLAVFDEGAGPRLFMAGVFDYNNGGGENIARWNGSSLTQVGTGSINSSTAMRLRSVRALQVFDDGTGAKLYAGGASVAAVTTPLRAWNGTAWSDGGSLRLSAFDAGLATVASLGVFDDGSGAQLFAAGRFAHAGSVFANGFASLSGNTWTAYGDNQTVNRPIHALTVFDDGNGEQLYAGGEFVVAGPNPAAAIARFDGQNWSSLAPAPISGGPVYALTTHDDGSGEELYAAGKFMSIGSVVANNIAKWNGTSWSSLANGIPGFGDQWVNALATYDDGNGDALYAAGRFTHAGILNHVNRIAKWDGATWSKVGTAGLDSEAYALQSWDDGNGARLYVGGAFLHAGTSSRPYVVSWDGTAWNDVGGGVNDYVHAFAVFDDGTGPALYVGGAFTAAGAILASRLARWDGAAWHAVGGGVDSTVESLAVFDDGSGPALYVAGPNIALAGGQAVRGIARWDGAQWSALNGGVLGYAMSAMTSFDDGTGEALFLGGNLLAANSSASINIAKWSRACSCAPSSYCAAGTTTNGCNAHISGVGSPSASAGSGFDLVVTSVEGQRNGLIFYGLSGAKSDPWGSGSSFVCVKAPQQRTGNQFSNGTNTGCDGVLTLDFNAYLASHPSALGQPFTSVTSVWAQAWFRDPPAPKGTNLSDAVEFSVCP